MTKTVGVLVLLSATLVAGPIKEQDDKNLAPTHHGLTTYAAFLELAGPVWLLGTNPGSFDSVLHYALSGLPPAAPIDPLAEPISAVPEPRSVALLAFGLAALALLGLRRRRRTHSNNL